MPAISDQAMDDGLVAWHSVQSKTVIITSGIDAGKTYTAGLLIAPPVVINGEVVQDNREEAVAVFSNDSYPNVKPGDYMRDEDGGVWKFGERDNNPVDSSVDFKIIKKTSQDK